METPVNFTDKIAFSVKEACAVTGIQRDSLYREINSGRLRTAKVKGRRLIRREALEEWLKSQESATEEAMGFKDQPDEP